MNYQIKQLSICKIVMYILLLNFYLVTQNAYANEMIQCAPDNIELKVYYEGSVKPRKKLPSSSSSPYSYYSFVNKLFDYTSTKVVNEAACQQEALEPVEISLTFVQRHMKMGGSDQKPKDISLESAPFSQKNFSCQLSSPWLKMTVQRNPRLKIAAIFAFDDRQFLIDQALLTYPNLAKTFQRQFLTTKLFNQYRDEYLTKYRASGKIPSPETARKIPIDMYWLFDHGLRGWMPSLYGAITRLIHDNHLGYHNIIKLLVNQCLTSDSYELQQYKTIYDLSKLIATLEIYNYPVKSLKQLNQ